MDAKTILQLLDLIHRKNKIDSDHSWSNGAETYLNEIRKEIIEVEEEIPLNRICYLPFRR